jgi:predicted HTH transcriptional regulator
VPDEIFDPNAESGEGLTQAIVDRLVAGDSETAVTLARRGESQWIELKEKLPQAPELAKELAAFANSGGGVLIVGAAHNGKVAGWRPADADMAVRRMREVANSALPNLTHVRRGYVDEGWLAWAVVDSASEPVVTAEGTYWRRVSNHIQRAELQPRGFAMSDSSASYEDLPQSDPIRSSWRCHSARRRNRR